MKDLVLADNAEITVSDLDSMFFQLQHVAKRKDECVAVNLRRVNPDVHSVAMGVPIHKPMTLMRVLRATTVASEDEPDNSERGDGSSGEEKDEWEDESDDEEDDDDDDEDYDVFGNDESAGAHMGSRPLHVIFLCVDNRELAVALNEFCCELGILFIYVFVGRNGISGEIWSIIPGRSSCLQCFERRKVLKLTGAEQAVGSDGDLSDGNQSFMTLDDQLERRRVVPCLPSTECILAGLGAHNAIMYVPAGVVVLQDSHRIVYIISGICCRLERSARGLSTMAIAMRSIEASTFRPCINAPVRAAVSSSRSIKPSQRALTTPQSRPKLQGDRDNARQQQCLMECMKRSAEFLRLL